MVFCGYDIYSHDSPLNNKDLDPAKEDDDDDDKEIEEPDDDNNGGFRTASESNVKYILWSAGKLDKLSDLDTGACGRAAGTKGIEYECRSLSELRNFLSSNFYKYYPTLEGDLINRRRQLLLGKGAGGVHGDQVHPTNLSSVVDQSPLHPRGMRRGVVRTSNMRGGQRRVGSHALRAAAAPSFLGCHDWHSWRQLTQAILLPDLAHVLELLPWITDYIR